MVSVRYKLQFVCNQVRFIWLKQSVARSSPRRYMFDPLPFHARSEVEKVLAAGQLFLEWSVSFPTPLHLQVALSRRTNGRSAGMLKKSDALSTVGGVSDKNVTLILYFRL